MYSIWTWNYAKQVWASVLGALVGVSLVLFFLARLTPHEWLAIEPPRAGGGMSAIGAIVSHSDALLENRFTLLNSFWLIVGSLFQQGTSNARVLFFLQGLGSYSSN